MPAKGESNAQTTESELALTRLFDAPRQLVYDAWTKPEHLERWQGAPQGFTVTSHKVDLRPGGEFRICMRSAEGADHWLGGVYREVVPPQRLVFTHGWLDEKGKPGQQTLVTITFTEREGKTELKLQQTGFKSAAARDGHSLGWNSMIDRFAEFLTEIRREFVISRVFNAPADLVFKAWTDPKHLAKWWGPHNFTNPVCQIDLRPGGAYRIVMRSPEGVDYPMKGVYREIVSPRRLVYTINLSEHPQEWHDLVHPNRPKSQRPEIDAVVTVTFEEQKGKTKMTVQMLFDSAQTRDSHVKLGMNEGWSQSFEKLEGLVAAGDREIVSTRTFDAPRDLVFDQWTSPEKIAKWWGPRGFTTTTHEMDVRPGGTWRFIMHGPDGVDYPNKIVYVEVVKPEKIVYDHVSGPKFRSTATFEDQDGKTKLTVRLLFESAAMRDRTAEEFGAVEGLNQTIGRLVEQVDNHAKG